MNGLASATSFAGPFKIAFSELCVYAGRSILFSDSERLEEPGMPLRAGILEQRSEDLPQQSIGGDFGLGGPHFGARKRLKLKDRSLKPLLGLRCRRHSESEG